MTGRQRLVCVAGILAAGASVAFPPWGLYDMGNGEKTDSVAFAFIARPPGSPYEFSPERGGYMPSDAVQIEWFQLAFRLIVIAIFTLILYSIASRRTSRLRPKPAACTT